MIYWHVPVAFLVLWLLLEEMSPSQVVCIGNLPWATVVQTVECVAGVTANCCSLSCSLAYQKQIV